MNRVFPCKQTHVLPRRERTRKTERRRSRRNRVTNSWHARGHVSRTRRTVHWNPWRRDRTRPFSSWMRAGVSPTKRGLEGKWVEKSVWFAVAAGPESTVCILRFYTYLTICDVYMYVVYRFYRQIVILLVRNFSKDTKMKRRKINSRESLHTRDTLPSLLSRFPVIPVHARYGWKQINLKELVQQDRYTYDDASRQGITTQS